ncbi:hypothetical protein [Acrocarpospora sp. B8E8]|uniref:hypothetical protein n=1 Tax=Acrocarpospora sp. B8E8 TaxID=3153572 RepID=UPI00325E57F9
MPCIDVAGPSFRRHLAAHVDDQRLRQAAHHFLAADEGTLMRDIVDFTAPYGSLGTLAELLVLRRYMTRLIFPRNQHIKELTEATARDAG